MSQWYLSYQGQQQGPFDAATAAARARANPNGHAWRDGMASWLPIADVTELSASAALASAPPPFAQSAPAAARSAKADVIDYAVFGEDMQFVEITLDAGESVVAEAGSMMFKDASVEMQTIFGDASAASQNAGLMDKLMSAGKRVITGEGLFTTLFTNRAATRAKAAFAAPYPGTIIPLALAQHGQRIICQKDSFLCAARGVSLSMFFQKKILTGLFGGEGFVMQKLEGDGLVFMHAGGTVVERQLAPGEKLHVDTGCVVAFNDSVTMDVKSVGGVKSMLFGGEGVFFAELTGPGHVWLQSLPFSRLAGRMLIAARSTQRDEGSVLGGLGGLMGGDRSF